mgnify:FL=1
MSLFLYSFFHNKTNDKSEEGKVFVPFDSSLWPDSWKIIEYKTYSLIKPLTLTAVKGIFFDDFLKKRFSNRGNAVSSFSDNGLTLEKISYLLKCCYGLQQNENFQKRK